MPGFVNGSGAAASISDGTAPADEMVDQVVFMVCQDLASGPSNGSLAMGFYRHQTVL